MLQPLRTGMFLHGVQHHHCNTVNLNNVAELTTSLWINTSDTKAENMLCTSLEKQNN